jgi:hypothetical protein
MHMYYLKCPTYFGFQYIYLVYCWSPLTNPHITELLALHSVIIYFAFIYVYTFVTIYFVIILHVSL